MPLGRYQFRRCQFAKNFIFTDLWGDLLKFAFSREPTDRCLSQFFYLFYCPGLKPYLRSLIRTRTVLLPRRRINYDFDSFLDMIEACRDSESTSSPASLSFQTHTAAMYPDISDEHGQMLLDYVFRLEDLPKGIRFIGDKLGIESMGIEDRTHVNKSGRNESMVVLNRQRRARIGTLFEKDFDVYEDAFTDFI